ncbi:MAG: hypothetical protein IT385_28690 [Deltaproteobacteria bacterium]|nr:hypothetical protein [Deltaproteobacteria bacterium]
MSELRAEVFYTRARLQDEAQAAALIARTDAWLVRIEAVDKATQALDGEQAAAAAAVVGADRALDLAVTALADDLYDAVGKDRSSARWRAFFRKSPSDFNRQELSEQVARVGGWLADARDEVLQVHRERLTAAVERCRVAQAREAALGTRRGGVWQDREALAAYLTDERDALHDELAAIARGGRLDRAWPATFFRTGRPARRRAGLDAGGDQPAEPSAPSGGGGDAPA